MISDCGVRLPAGQAGIAEWNNTKTVGRKQ
jgi:hypothetical protein